MAATYDYFLPIAVMKHVTYMRAVYVKRNINCGYFYSGEVAARIKRVKTLKTSKEKKGGPQFYPGAWVAYFGCLLGEASMWTMCEFSL